MIKYYLDGCNIVKIEADVLDIIAPKDIPLYDSYEDAKVALKNNLENDIETFKAFIKNTRIFLRKLKNKKEERLS